MTSEPQTPAPTSKPARRHSVTVMLMVIALAVGVMAYVKQRSEKMHAEQAAAAALTKQQRDAATAAIMQSIAHSYRTLSNNQQQLALVERVGAALASKSDARLSPVRLKFHLLSEPDAINLFALSSGDIYITTALLNRMQTEGQLAAVLAHGVAHVLAGDIPELVPAPAGSTALPLWRYTTAQEHTADTLSITLMAQAGYDPTSAINMFLIQLTAYQAGADVAFFISHPNEPQRLENLRAVAMKRYPNGVPAELSK